MKKLCINNRDELVFINLADVAYLMADGNYTKIVYIKNMQTVLSLGISKVENMIKQSITTGDVSPFVRLGRSLIINQSYLCGINLVQQKLILSDFGTNSRILKLPKQLLKNYKDMIVKANNNRNK